MVHVLSYTKQYTFLCSYLQDPSILCLHFWLLHVTVRYFALCYTIGTCMYVCMYIRYCKYYDLMLGWNWSCTNNIFSLHSVWHVKQNSSFLPKLNAFCPKNNASQSWPTVQLAVPLQEPCDCMHVQTCWYSITVTVWLCACTDLLVQHYSNCVIVCMYRPAVTALQ
jgi:hypothetical protein